MNGGERQARYGTISIRAEWGQAMWGKRATGHRCEGIDADRKREMNAKRLLSSSLVTFTGKSKGGGVFEWGGAYPQTGSLQGRASSLNRSGTNRNAEGPTSMLSGSHISIGIAYPTWKIGPSLVAALPPKLVIPGGSVRFLFPP